VGAGVEPGGAAGERDQPKLALREVEPVEVGDLQFAARRGLRLLALATTVPS